MDYIASSRWKTWAVRFAIFFPIFLLARQLLGHWLIAFAIAYPLMIWIDPVRRTRSRQRQMPDLDQIFH